MRVIAALLGLACAAVPAGAAADPPHGTVFEVPSTWAEAQLAVASLHAASVQGGAATLRIRGAWHVLPPLEIGGAIAAQAFHLDDEERQVGYGRAGLAWGRLTVGTGILIERAAAFSFRLHFETAPRTVGLEAIDAGARGFGYRAEAAFGFVSDAIVSHAGYELGWIGGDGGVTHFNLVHHVAVSLGVFHPEYWPLLDLEVLVDFGERGGFDIQLHLGSLIRDRDDNRDLRVTLDLGIPGLSQGHLIGVTLAGVIWPESSNREVAGTH